MPESTNPHQHVVLGLTFSSKDSNDRLGSRLGRLQERQRDVSQHRNAPDAAVGAASAAAADLAAALSGGADNQQVHAALSRLREVAKDSGAHLVHRRSGDKGGPTAHLQNQLDKAQASLQQAEANLGRIAAAGQSAASHGSGVVNAGSGSQVANNVAGLFGDLAEGLDALGDLIGGPAGVALSALATLTGEIGDVISTVFGDGSS
jgi:hypothetical protein